MSIPDAVMHFLTRLQHLGDKSYKKGLQASKNTSIDFNDIKDKVGVYVSERDGLKHTQRDGLEHTRALEYTPWLKHAIMRLKYALLTRLKHAPPLTNPHRRRRNDERLKAMNPTDPKFLRTHIRRPRNTKRRFSAALTPWCAWRKRGFAAGALALAPPARSLPAARVSRPLPTSLAPLRPSCGHIVRKEKAARFSGFRAENEPLMKPARGGRPSKKATAAADAVT